MINLEKEISDKIKEILKSENISFDRHRKIPELSIRVDFFLFTQIPTVIEVKILRTTYFRNKLMLMSRFLQIKLINDGNIRVIVIFIINALNYGKTLLKFKKFIKENKIINESIDKIIFLESLQEGVEKVELIRKYLYEPINIHKIIKEISRLKDREYSEKRVNYTVDNIKDLPDRRSFIFSLYYLHFNEKIQDDLKESFIKGWKKQKEALEDNYRQRSIVGSYYISNSEYIFEHYINLKGWKKNDKELEAILYKFKKKFQFLLNRDFIPLLEFAGSDFKKKFTTYKSIIDDYLESNRSKYKAILKNHYDRLNDYFYDYLINYFLRNSAFNEYLPLKNISIMNEDLRDYYKINIANKPIIMKSGKWYRKADSIYELYG